MPKSLAIVGSGPAAFYALLRVLKRHPDLQVDIFERHAVPFGLTRYGVAPDHPEVRACQERFTEITTEWPGVKFWGNTQVGRDVQLAGLKQNYNAVLLAYGAETERKLNIPGEDLPGVFSARQFVGWYNGEPEFQGIDFANWLSRAKRATIIGNGNVSLDVARVLLGGADRLKHTDISSQAIAALQTSKVENVDIVARRGPIHAAFTNKELRELQGLHGVTMLPPHPAPLYSGDLGMVGRKEKRRLELLERPRQPHPEDKTWQLQFYRAPVAFNGSDKVASVDWAHTIQDPADANKVIRTTETDHVETDIIFKSIGYRSVPLPGMGEAGIVFDPRLGVVVTNSQGLAAPVAPEGSAVYATGWLKTGPVGTIATTMMDAFNVGEEIATHFDGELVSAPGRDGLNSIMDDHRTVSWEDWQKIDAEEQRRGKAEGKERVKFQSLDEILAFLDS